MFRIALLISLLTLTLSSGRLIAQGVRWHDSQSQTLADTARDSFNKLTQNQSSVFDTMSANTVALQTATISELHDLNRARIAAAVQNIPTMTWSQLRAKVVAEQSKVIEYYSNANRIAGAPAEQVNSLQSLADNAKKKLQELTAQQTKAETALAQTELQLKDMKTSVESVRQSITESAKPIKSLSDLKEFQNLATAWKSMKNMQAWISQAENIHGGPGLQLTILDLGVQHQTHEVERAQLALQHATALTTQVVNISDILQLLIGDGAVDNTQEAKRAQFGILYTYVTPCSPNSQPQPCPLHPFLTSDGTNSGVGASACPRVYGTADEKIIVTIGKLAKAATQEVGTCVDNSMALHNLVDILNIYASIISYDEFLLLQFGINITSEQQLYSIRLSQINAADREALISHGLSGLAEYYEGGITSQDIANVFQAADAIATAVIAGRIN